MLIQLQPEGHPLSIHPLFLLFFILIKQPCDYTLVPIFIFSRETKHAQALSYLMGVVGPLLLRALNSMWYLFQPRNK